MLTRIAVLIAALMFGALHANATYSIVACDEKTGECGVAVQTNNLAVGASVPHARAGVGAIASQFETNPRYGPRGLALLSQGKGPEEVLRQLLDEDGNFDGEGIEARQVGIVSLDGRTAVHTGKEAEMSAWAGSRTGKGFSVQGNGLAGPQVLEAMEQAFVSTTGTLAERLMAALVAGDAAGGQKTGRESAALLVRTTDGFPLDIDLRIDHSSDPVGDLRKLLDIQTGRQMIVQANVAARNGGFQVARSLMISAVSKAPQWPRIWLRAARVAMDIEEPELAAQYLNIVFSMNREWAEAEIGGGNYAELGADPLFHRWVSVEKTKAVLAAYQRISKLTSLAPGDRLETAKKLLEVGEPEEALRLLVNQPELNRTPEASLLRASAYAALGKYQDAVQQCHSGLESNPENMRLRARTLHLESTMRNAK